MSEFDEWFKSLNEGGRATYFLGQEGNISKEAWNHQQAKIDDLQGRIDGALEKCYTGIRKQGGDHYLELVENILKGNKDEN